MKRSLRNLGLVSIVIGGLVTAGCANTIDRKFYAAEKYSNKGKYEKAIEEYEDIAEIYLEKLNDPKKAIEIWEKLLEQCPPRKNDTHDIGRFYSTLEAIAHQSEKIGEYEKAIKTHDKIIKDSPYPSFAIRSLYKSGLIYSDKLNDPKKAIEIWEKLLEQYPEEKGYYISKIKASTLDGLAFAYDRIGEKEKAIEAQERSIKYKKEIEIQMHKWANTFFKSND